MKCLNPKCENDVPEGSRSTRKFCGDACRQQYFRQQHQQDQAQGRTFTEMLSELTELREQVSDQAQEIAQLRHLLDVEKRYYEDTQAHTFKAWLRKQPPSPVASKLLSDQLVPARGSRALYEAHMRRLHSTDNELLEFTRLWKLMLLSRP
jgi:hypothetical protein